MEPLSLDNFSIYRGNEIILTTKHRKSQSIAPVFEDILRAKVIEKVLDTDILGTFTGEIKRQRGMLESARQKCLWGLKETGSDYGLASEGSFGPHPLVPFVACDREIIYFIDQVRDFHFHLHIISEKTNYAMKLIESLEELNIFAEHALFPSHGLIIRPNIWESKTIIFKGIQSQADLECAFKESLHLSPDNKAWVETDMRAHLNPSRRAVLADLAKKIASRLRQYCKSCSFPGWGQISLRSGLPCSDCGYPTKLVCEEIYGCLKCPYQETIPYPKGLEEASPQYCQICNP